MNTVGSNEMLNLNQRIAGILGYTPEVIQLGKYNEIVDSGAPYSHGRWLQIYDGDELWVESFPANWSENPRDAFQLIQDSNCSDVSLKWDGKLWRVSLNGHVFWGEIPSQLLCLAWLAWKENPHKTTITGASDDLIEVEGQLVAEFDYYNDNEPGYLSFSDGTLIECRYDNQGIWRFNVIFQGTSKWTKTDGDIIADTNDKIILDGDLSWVTFTEYRPAHRIQVQG